MWKLEMIFESGAMSPDLDIVCFQVLRNHAATASSLAPLESASPPAGSVTATSTARIAATRRLPSALPTPPVFLVK